MNWKKRIVIGALFVAIILAVGYGFWPRPILVEGVEVIRAPLRVILEERGRTEVIDRFVVSAPVAGFMHRVELNVGDPVTKGEAIVYLEPLRPVILDLRSRAKAEAAIDAAKAALGAAEEIAHAAKVDAGHAATRFNRIQQLYKAGYVSQDKMDMVEAEAERASAKHRSSEFRVRAAHSEVEATRAALKFLEGDIHDPPEKVAIRAPICGYILEIYRADEGVIGSGEPLVGIGNLHALEVKVDLLSADAVLIMPGMPAIFDQWGGDIPLKGRVRVVEPVGFTKISVLGVEEQRVLVFLYIISPRKEWERLGAGYSIDVSLILWEGDNVLQVPIGALFRYEVDWAVFTVEDGRAHLRLVQIGHQDGLVAEVVSGLAEREVVIVHPDPLIKDGSRVQLKAGVIAQPTNQYK